MLRFVNDVVLRCNFVSLGVWLINVHFLLSTHRSDDLASAGYIQRLNDNKTSWCVLIVIHAQSHSDGVIYANA